jgi:predicted membrane GTPase involved in stress response
MTCTVLTNGKHYCNKSLGAAKIDSGEIETAILDLFVALDATNEQLGYKTVY